MRTYTISGTVYPSVTTVLKVVNKPGLNYWITANAVKAALKHEKEKPGSGDKKLAQEAPKKELSKAIQRGRRVHEYAAEYADGKRVAPSDGYEEAVENYFLAYTPKPLLTEVTVFHQLYNYAGTADTVSRIDGETWLIDYKTSKKMYPEMHLQVSAYAHAPQYLEGEEDINSMPFINKLGVVLFHASGEVSFKEVPDCFPAFLSALGLWKWFRRWGE